jgi:uncharacterized protein DUF5681
MPDDYDVGYKRPPKRSQWSKGKSGNPQGRVKGIRNMKTEFTEELSETLRIKEQGVPKKITKQRAVIKSLTAKAVQGDTRATSILFNMMFRLMHSELTETAPVDFSQEDQEILDAFIARRRSANDQGGKR